MGRRRKGEVSERQVIEELAAIGFAKVTDYLYVEDNVLMIRPTEELTEREKAAIAAVERTSSGIKVKFYDKIKALELLGKHIGMFDGKGAPKGTDNNLLEAILAATREEVDLHDIPELQQAADAGNELVEPAGTQQL